MFWTKPVSFSAFQGEKAGLKMANALVEYTSLYLITAKNPKTTDWRTENFSRRKCAYVKTNVCYYKALFVAIFFLEF